MGPNESTPPQIIRAYNGYVVETDCTYPISIEYRFDGELYYVLIESKGEVFNSFGDPSFDIVSDWLASIPKSSMVVFRHNLSIITNDITSLVEVEERLFPYHVDNSATVVYQISLQIPKSQNTIETIKSVDFASVMEDLREKLNGESVLRACYYCKYMVDYHPFQGSDLRRDKLFCFRDAQEYLPEVLSKYPFNPSNSDDNLFIHAAKGIDSLHSCGKFELMERPRFKHKFDYRNYI